jgi:hypothetical protein
VIGEILAVHPQALGASPSSGADRCARACRLRIISTSLSAGGFGAAAGTRRPADASARVPAEGDPGRWGFAAYHKEDDRVRTEAAAKAQCDNPYVINLGPTGGVMMHLADDAKASELHLKGAPGGKTYVGPEGPPASPQDREVVTFDGRF